MHTHPKQQRERTRQGATCPNTCNEARGREYDRGRAHERTQTSEPHTTHHKPGATQKQRHPQTQNKHNRKTPQHRAHEQRVRASKHSNAELQRRERACDERHNSASKREEGEWSRARRVCCSVTAAACAAACAAAACASACTAARCCYWCVGVLCCTCDRTYVAAIITLYVFLLCQQCLHRCWYACRHAVTHDVEHVQLWTGVVLYGASHVVVVQFQRTEGAGELLLCGHHSEHVVREAQRKEVRTGCKGRELSERIKTHVDLGESGT